MNAKPVLGDALSSGSVIDTRTFLLLSICAFASMASMRVCDAMLPSFASEFASTTGQAARTISGFAMAYGILQLFYGSLGDRYGKVRVVGLATLGCTAGSAGAAFSPNLDWLVFSRILSGVMAAGIIPLTMAWIGDNVAYDGRQEVLARLLVATVLGMIFGQWLGGVVADLLGWREVFVMLTLVFMSAGTLLTRRAGVVSFSAQISSESIARRVLRVLHRPWARTVLLVTYIDGALVFSALAFIPSHLHASFDLSMPKAGTIVALYGVGGLLYSRCARTLLRRLGESGLVVTGGIGLGVAFGTIALASTWYWALPACFLAGFGFYALHNTLQAHATQMVPAVRGTAVSLFACILFWGQSIGVLVAAWIVDSFSSTTVLASSALALPLLGVGFALLIRQYDGGSKVA